MGQKQDGVKGRQVERQQIGEKQRNVRRKVINAEWEKCLMRERRVRDLEQHMRERDDGRGMWRESCSVRYDQKSLYVKGLKGESCSKTQHPHSKGRKQNGGNKKNQ